MNRRTERDLKAIWRRFSPRHSRTIITFLSTLVVCTAVVYITINYIVPPIQMSLTTETTTTTTTQPTTPETTTEKSFDFGCFFDQTNITLADGSTRPLNTLTTADEVLVYSTSGQLQKSRILTVFHHQRSSVRFLDIYTTNNAQPLRLTPSHSILTKKANAKQLFFDYDFAYNLAIDDWIYSSQLKSVRIVNIKEIILYNQIISTPLTFEGNIIVNDFIASCYATYHHQWMHILTTPIRYGYQIQRFSQLNSILVHLIDFYSTKSV